MYVKDNFFGVTGHRKSHGMSAGWSFLMRQSCRAQGYDKMDTLYISSNYRMDIEWYNEEDVLSPSAREKEHILHYKE